LPFWTALIKGFSKIFVFGDYTMLCHWLSVSRDERGFCPAMVLNN